MAVIANDLCFSYFNHKENQFVLTGVDLNVDKGVVYSLLGPSGCGKTTLLKIIIGLLKPVSGSIHVFGYEPGCIKSGVPGSGVGYMPQELAVQNSLTIEETLNYFASFHCLEEKEKKEEIEYWVKTLELPKKTRLVGNMSDGQKRRVSFAIAVIHKPRLLILDEPTVGVDPILSDKIWRLMLDLTKNRGTTIIITTHYIEETKRSNFVAFMRKGQILEEAPLQLIMSKYDRASLDSIIVNLCKIQDYRSNRPMVGENKKKNYRINREPFHLKHSYGYMAEKKVMTLIEKYMKQIRRNPISICVLFFLTIFTVVLITFSVGKTPNDLPVAWIDEGLKANTNLLIEFNEYENDTIELVYLPPLLRQSINSKVISLQNYTNYEKAMSDLRRAKIYGIIFLSPKFSRSYLEGDVILNLGSNDWVDNTTIAEGSITLTLDRTKKVIASVIENTMFIALLKFRKLVAAAYEVDESGFVLPIKLGEAVYGHLDLEDFYGAREFVAPALILVVSHLFAMGTCILEFVLEQENEMFIRNYVAGVSSFQMVLGESISRFLFIALSSVVNFYCSIYFLDIPCKGDVGLVLTLLWMQALVGCLMGMFLGICFPDILFAIFLSYAYLNYANIANGIFWSIETLPYYLKWLCYIMPFYYPAQSIRSLMIKENPPFNALILPGFVSSALWILVLFFLCVLFLKRRN